jgi:predicted nuclease of predicted toxin-antitoxin system
MRTGRPYLKQKPRLYFDENVPEEVTYHFRDSSYWKSKVRTTTAFLEGNVKRSDLFHYRFCQRHRLTLVTLDDDFADDRRYPFTHGMMAGIIIVRASSSAPPAIVGLLAMLLDFVIIFPFPRGLLLLARARSSACRRIRHAPHWRDRSAPPICENGSRVFED